MKLCFDSIEEVKEFVTQLKGTRGKKGEADDAPPVTGQVPAPMAIPTQQPTAFNPAGFAPQVAGAAPGAAGPFAVAAPTVDPRVAELVAKVSNAIATRTAPGTEAAALDWFRNECVKVGLDAAGASMDQIKANFLPKMAVPALENIAKLMGCA